MSNLTLWGANQFSRILFGQRSPIGDYYLALGTDGTPSSFMSGNEIIEPTPGSGYLRLPLLNNADVFDTDGYQTAFNRTQLTFPEATSDWGDLRYWALCNDSVAGEVYCYGTFTSLVRVLTGDQVLIQPGTLKIQFSISASADDPF